LTSIILSFIFSSFIILVWVFIWCSQGWSSTILDLTNILFGNLSCFRHLLNSNVLSFTYFVLCCCLWGQRFQVKGVRLKFKGLRSEVIMLGLRSLCQVKGLTKLKVWTLNIYVFFLWGLRFKVREFFSLALLFCLVCSCFLKQVYAVLVAMDLYKDFMPWSQSSHILWHKHDDDDQVLLVT
jgi:hypothetical protein